MAPKARRSGGLESCRVHESQTSSDLFIQHGDTHMVRREMLTLELNVQAEKRHKKGGTERKLDKKGGERKRDAAEVRGCRGVCQPYCVYPVSPFK